MKLKEEYVKKLADKVGNDVDFEKIIPTKPVLAKGIELVDDKLFEFIFVGLNEAFGANIPAPYHPAIESVIDAYVSGDYSNLDEEAIELFKDAFPYFSDHIGGKILSACFQAVCEVIEDEYLKA